MASKVGPGGQTTEQMAILQMAQEMMKAHRLEIVDASPDFNDNSMVAMNDSTMKGLAKRGEQEIDENTGEPLIDEETGEPVEPDMIDFFDQDFCQIVGRMKLSAIAVMNTDDELGDGQIAMNASLRQNLKVKIGDFVTVHGIEDGQKADEITIAPVQESLEGLDASGADSMRRILEPYFNDFKDANDVQRPAWKGQIITVTAAMHDILFKVVECTDGAHYVQLEGASVTNMTIAPPISDDDAMAAINEVGYSDIGGLKEQLAQIRETVELPIRHPTLFRKIGVRPPKGVLMHGPPGCGKTMIARAIAHETGSFFVLINGPEIIGGGAGESEQNIRTIFKTAREKAEELGHGAIIFIDEIDSIAPNRDKVQDQAMQRIVATLLTEMDGLKAGAHIMVIGATNRPNSLDPALRRSGRFDTEIVIPVPSQSARLEILNIVTRKQRKAEDVDMEKIAELTAGYVGADLANLASKSAIGCIRRCARGIIDMEEEDIPVEFLNSLHVSMNDYMEGLKVTGSSITRDVKVETPDITFDDIGGLEECKQELQEMIAMPYTHADFFEDMHIQPPKGALMYGPPGCGKTLMAKAIANECKANFISIKGPQLLSKWIGESEQNVRNIFAKARQATPCVLFFDELDSVAGKRGQSTSGLTDKVVNQLLTEMDGVGDRGNLFIIGATNMPTALDPAVIRPGRLDQMIYVPMPDPVARAKIFQAILRKSAVSKRLDFKKLADATHHWSGADIKGICSMATKIDMRRRIEKIIVITDELMEKAKADQKPLTRKDAMAQAKKGFVGTGPKEMVDLADEAYMASEEALAAAEEAGEGVEEAEAAADAAYEALMTAKEYPKWIMSPDVFEMAYNSSSPSVPEADIQRYDDMAAEMKKGQGAQFTTDAAMAGPNLVKQSADIDDDEMSDELAYESDDE